MNFIFIKIAIRRFFELMITCAGVSAVITFLHTGDELTTESSLFVALLIGLIVFVAVNVRMLRQCYFDLRSNVIYYFVNISAYLLFICVTIAVYCFGSKECFTWLFAITKFAKYLDLDINNLLSVFIFHIIGLLTVKFATIGMKWVFYE